MFYNLISLHVLFILDDKNYRALTIIHWVVDSAKSWHNNQVGDISIYHTSSEH